MRRKNLGSCWDSGQKSGLLVWIEELLQVYLLRALESLGRDEYFHMSVYRMRRETGWGTHQSATSTVFNCEQLAKAKDRRGEQC